MAGLKQIKSKIRSVEKTQTVTKAMEAVSAAKMRKSQQKALAARSYSRAALSVLERVSGSEMLKNHPLARGAGAFSSVARVDTPTENAPAPSRALYIVITSDKGLAGALNSAVLRKVQADILQSGLTIDQVSIIAVGKKAQDFFTNRGYDIVSYHPNTEDISSEMIDALVAQAANRFVLQAVDVVKIAYQQFVSTFEQRPEVRTVFPLSLEAIVNPAAEQARATHYVVEPSEEEVLNAILPKLASIFVYHALLESQASEHSARMVAMKSASDKAEEMEHSLTLQFNKARQAAITREVSEITGGMEAMAQ